MKQIAPMRLLCSTVALLAASAAAAAPVVTNVRASQRTGTHLVDVYYDLQGAIPATRVSLLFSPDNGTTYTITPSSAHLTGDVGEITTSSVDKHIVWDAGVDYPNQYHPQCKAKVIATDDILTIILPGGVPMELVYTPAGTFTMGSPPGELSRRTDETQFDVQLTSSPYVGRTEVTQRQWLAMMGSWPGTPPSATFGVGDNYPAYYVSWNDAQDFLTALNAHIVSTGQGPATVRLPTEAEWEHFCRAGTTTRFSFGDALGADDDCSAEQVRVDNMWYCGNNGALGTPTYGNKVVAQKPTNPFGLYDTHGSVYEWCQDWYGTYPTSPPVRVNPTGPVSGSGKVVRGASWLSETWYCRSARRVAATPTNRFQHFGFRVVADRP